MIIRSEVFHCPCFDVLEEETKRFNPDNLRDSLSFQGGSSKPQWHSPL